MHYPRQQIAAGNHRPARGGDPREEEVKKVDSATRRRGRDAAVAGRGLMDGSGVGQKLRQKRSQVHLDRPPSI
jgi:hypothetical protein